MSHHHADYALVASLDIPRTRWIATRIGGMPVNGSGYAHDLESQHVVINLQLCNENGAPLSLNKRNNLTPSFLAYIVTKTPPGPGGIPTRILNGNLPVNVTTDKAYVEFDIPDVGLYELKLMGVSYKLSFNEPVTKPVEARTKVSRMNQDAGDGISR